MEAKYIVVLCLAGVLIVGLLVAVVASILVKYQTRYFTEKWNKQDYAIRINTTYKGYDITLWVYNVYPHDYDLELLYDSDKSRRVYGLITKWWCFPSFHIIQYREKWQFYDDALKKTLNLAKTMIDNGSIDRWFDTARNLDNDRASEFLEKQNHEEFKMMSNRPSNFYKGEIL